MSEKKHKKGDIFDKFSADLDTLNNAELVVASENLPLWLPLVPLRPRPAFPGLVIPLVVTGQGSVDAVQWALDSPTPVVGLVLARDPDAPDTPENIHSVGVAAKIIRVIHQESDSIHILANCVERFTANSIVENEKRLFAKVEYHYEPEIYSDPDQELKAFSMAILTALKELVQINPLYSEELKMFLNHTSLDNPGRLADFSANLTSFDGQELQDVLATFDVHRRIEKVLVLLKKELEVSRLQNRISKRIEQRVSAQQREFFLKEQLKQIKQELGLEKEGKVTEVEKFLERLEKLKPTKEARNVIDEEMEKFKLLEPSSAEYNVSRSYLDWLTILPWGKFSKDSFKIDRARKILNRDHYGLEDVKERILEFIAVGKLKGDISGSIICLVGPPGVGKTSVGRSIASAIGRKFYQFSLGGMRDEAEIKGHRRTYIGAMPGKFIQAMKTVGTANPVIMLDEIDKIGASFQGDPASALLEVLDPEQNGAFRDHYLDVPFDLSNVLFICTANQLDTIPAPLIDRMETIRLSGYILREKCEIAKRYLIPKALKAHGLKGSQFTLSKGALERIIDGYAREAGVRSLENLIKKLMRKVAMKFASEDNGDRVSITKKDVIGYLGNPSFEPDQIFSGRAGVVTGLAWTSRGGATLQIEATAMESRGRGFKQTGQLGKVMIESSEIAYSYVMGHLDLFEIKRDFFKNNYIHLHVPAGATPKDGPSAGITMATALLSMIHNRPLVEKLGMTGELTLTGRVLPIGGLKEKVIASRRIGLKILIFPELNRKEFDELPEYLKDGLTVHFVSTYEDVYKIVFPRAQREE